MRKVFAVIIAVMLLIGISGCGSAPAKDDVANACNIVSAINGYKLPDDVSLEDAKKHIKNIWSFWPDGLSDEEERAAWELVVYDDENIIADLTPEADKALEGEIRYESERIKIANASSIAEGINVYNALNPNNDPLPGDITLAQVKKALEETGLWPLFLTDDEAGEAWNWIEIKDGTATVKE